MVKRVNTKPLNTWGGWLMFTLVLPLVITALVTAKSVEAQ